MYQPKSARFCAIWSSQFEPVASSAIEARGETVGRRHLFSGGVLQFSRPDIAICIHVVSALGCAVKIERELSDLSGIRFKIHRGRRHRAAALKYDTVLFREGCCSNDRHAHRATMSQTKESAKESVSESSNISKRVTTFG